MKDLLIKLSVKMELLKDALKDENGQDLIEYGLLVAFVAFAATAGMTILAGDINAAFTTIGGDLTTAIA
jgi:pilus assembly protein Flp/PilA